MLALASNIENRQFLSKMPGKELQKASILLLLSHAFTACGERDSRGPSRSIQDDTKMLVLTETSLRGRDFDVEVGDLSDTTRIQHNKMMASLLRRRIEAESAEFDLLEIMDDKDEEDPTIDHDPNRAFTEHDYVAKEKYVETYNTGQIITTSVTTGSSELGRQSNGEQNNTDTEGEEMDADEQTPNGNAAADPTLEDNTQEALIRHVEPPQEIDILSDSIYVPRPQQNDNVFSSRQHDQN